MKKFISLFLFVSLLFSNFLVAFAEFSDVPDTHPNFLAIKFLEDHGIVQGYDDGTFKPAQLVNRVEALKIILKTHKIDFLDKVEETGFPDVQPSDWFAPFVVKAKELNIVKGNPDGTFTPARNVVRAEFIKMLLMSNGFKTDKWVDQSLFNDIPKDAWFTPYMNYAGKAGLITPDTNNNLYPGKDLTRGEVAEIIYLMSIILNGKNIQFLISQGEDQMGQIDKYIGNNDPFSAKRASELAVDVTMQAYKLKPDDKVVLSAAKLAKAYDYVVNAYIKAISKKTDEAKEFAQKAIDKANEAWEVNNDIQPIAHHIKERANEIISQLSTEN